MHVAWQETETVQWTYSEHSILLFFLQYTNMGICLRFLHNNWTLFIFHYFKQWMNLTKWCLSQGQNTLLLGVQYWNLHCKATQGWDRVLLLFCYESCPRCRTNRSTCWFAVQQTTSVLWLTLCKTIRFNKFNKYLHVLSAYIHCSFPASMINLGKITIVWLYI